MMKNVLQDFRRGLAQNDFTLKEAADATGIPYNTLRDMKRVEYATTVFKRLQDLERGLEILSKSKEKGRA